MKEYPDNNFKSTDKNDKQPLWEEIRTFSKTKYFIAIALLLIAGLGIIVPIIPGIIFLILAIALFRKGWMSKIRERIRLWKMKE